MMAKGAEERPPGWASRHGVALGGWSVILILLAVSAAPLIAPGQPIDTTPGEFSSDRAIEHVASIAQEAHPIGSPAIVRVRSYLVAELTALGLDPELQTVTVADYFGDPGGTVEIVNVMARIPGRESTGAIALVGHYDSVPTTTGANDDSAAIGAILETGRALLAGPSLRNDVILLFTDGEEPAPRYGSTAFVAEHAWAAEVAFIVNFEAVGGSGPSMVIETNGSESLLVEGLAKATEHPVAFSFLPETVELIGGVGTDFDPFLAEGVPGFHLAYLRGSPIYHTFSDSLARVSLASLYHHGSYALGLSRHFGEADLLELAPPEKAVYFTVGRWVQVHYAAGWVVPLAMLVVALFGVSVVRRVNRGESSLRALLAGVLVVTIRILAAVVVATLAWKVLTSVRRSPGVLEGYLYLLALLALSAGIWLTILRASSRRKTKVDMAGGIVLSWVILAVIASFWAPRMGYLFAWPALVGSLVLVFPPAQGWTRLGSLGLLGLPTLVLLVPAIDTFFQMALPRPGNLDSEMVEVIAVVIFLAALSAALIAACHQRSSNTVMTPE
jgi:hypothetical protein